MTDYRRILLFLGALLFIPATAGAQVALSFRIGTLGPGVEVTGRVLPNLNLRLSGSYLPYSFDGVYTEEIVALEYTTDLTVMAVSALADYFPFGSGVRLTAGLAYNGTSVNAFIAPSESYTVGNRTFTAEQLGTLAGTADYATKLSPYAGIGFGNAVRPGKRLGFVFDVGAMYTQAPTLALEGTGMIGPTAEQADVVNDKLSGIKLLPVVALGLSIAF